ncbi:MAG: beta-ketoacyl synthase N-terminal-like domain-containing protein [Trichodesmium sp. MO_231.B1]|nr:beta-ketoacyl synthase N-terminal-like domain-containing protein [Trichodesmium sp. MO_231.B1]
MEPIAIIGISCRFPGAKNLESFWELLSSGKEAISEVTPERWHIDSCPHRWGGFIKNVDRFDANFFGIAPREAERIDPQHRLLLEVTWEALENAFIIPEKLSGSKTGVFIGISNLDYHRLLYKDSFSSNAYDGIGTAASIAANRLSYSLNLQGPSMVVDTACSSSLVAVHLATQSLQTKESNLCLVGGVNLILSPEITATFSEADMMAADGRCKTFDASADGYVRGEGCGVIVLKRLADAIDAGDNILAVIHGSAVNQDGLSNGITAPNGPAQQAVISQALAKANVEPHRISYVEVHGTGTSLGDPIEVRSLKKVLMSERSNDKVCWMGSVKTNIGHLEAAAGIAGLIKVVLSLQHQEIPPHLHLKKLNPLISLADTPFAIPTEPQPWLIDTEPRFAGVSSFGFGGTNAHVVLAEAPVVGANGHSPVQPFARTEVRSDNDGVTPLEKADGLERPVHLLTLSAKNEGALRELAQCYVEKLEFASQVSLSDICFTANTARSRFSHRLAVVAESIGELSDRLKNFIEAEKDVFIGKVRKRKKPKIAFLFTGQGSQYINMGRQLYEESSVFREAINKCDEILGTFHTTSLKEILYPEDINAFNLSILNQTAHTQPALFAIEYALAQLWQSWGIKPDIVMGHSVGEYVAACVAGVFSLEDGLKLIVSRGRLMQQLPSGGEMVSVMASESYVREALASVPQISIAAINGPESVVISGESVAVRSLVNSLELSGIKTTQLQVSHAFHSPLMEPMLTVFEAVANQITYNNPQIPIISNVTGTTADNSIASAQYWVDHICKPVLFAQGMETLHKQGAEIFLEIGPKPILLGMGRRCLPEDVGVWLPSLRPRKIPLQSPLETGKSEDVTLLRKIPLPSPLEKGMPEDVAFLKDEWQQMLSSLGELYVRGAEIDWMGVDQDYTRQKVTLPTYPFQRQRYWVKTAIVDSSHDTQSLQFSTGHKSNIQSLINYLKTTGGFSDSELKIFDKVQYVLDNDNNFVTQVEELEQSKTHSEFIQSLEKTPQKERRNILINHLQNQIATVLGLPPSELPDPEIGFFEMGMDSLMAVELKKRLEKTLLISLSPTLAFNYPNIYALSSYIIEDILGFNETKNEAIKSTKNNKDTINLLSEIEELSEDEIEASIFEEISELETILK